MTSNVIEFAAPQTRLHSSKGVMGMKCGAVKCLLFSFFDVIIATYLTKNYVIVVVMKKLTSDRKSSKSSAVSVQLHQYNYTLITIVKCYVILYLLLIIALNGT